MKQLHDIEGAPAGVRLSLIWVAAALLVCAKLAATFALLAEVPPVVFAGATAVSGALLLAAGAWRGPRRASVWLWLFVGACALSIATNTIAPIFNPWGRLANLVMLLVLVSPLVTTPGLTTFRQCVLRLFVAGCAVVTAVSFVMYVVDVASDAIAPYAAYAGLCLRPMTLSPLAAIAAIGALTLLMRTERRVWQLVAGAMMLIGVWMSLQGGSRMVQLALVVAVAAVIWLEGTRGNRRRAVVAIAVTAACVAVLHTPALRIIEYKVELGIENGSMTYSRDNQWSDRWGEFVDHPLTGVGFAAIERDTNPWSDREAIETRGNVEPGSSWLSVASSTGLCGVVTLCGFLWTVGAAAWQAVRRRRALTAVVTVLFVALVGVTEGFVLFAGSPLCMLFWLCCGLIADEAKSGCARRLRG